MADTERYKMLLNGLAEKMYLYWGDIEQDVPDQSYLVGGAVRDTLLGLEPNDFDFVVTGETASSMRERGFEPIEASSFPVFHDSEHNEWALARREEKNGYGYDGFEVFTNDVDLTTDLKRRDLTINSLALDVGQTNGMGAIMSGESWDLVAPMNHNGYEQPLNDLQNGVLRHVSDAFAEDPLRILRVARYAGRFAVPADRKPVQLIDQPDGSARKSLHRFASQTDSEVHDGFRVAPETVELMQSISHELNLMSRDRVGSELIKALDQARRPSRIFEVLQEAGALSVLWPELDRGDIVLAGREKHHAEGSVFNHTMLVLDKMYQICDEHNITGHDRVRRLFMALGHDMGKVLSADKQGGIHSDDPPTGFPGHAELGAGLMQDTARRLGLPSEIKNVMADGASYHMRFHDIPMMSANELLDFIGDTFPSGVHNDGMRELPTNDAGDPHSFHAATAWELLDLSHADHEGRLKTTFVDEGGGVTDTSRKMVSQPEFDREQFVARIEAVFNAEQNVDGYKALEKGLCDEHSESEIDRTTGTHLDEDRSVQSVMASCESCRTPDDWVGSHVRQMKQNLVNEVLSEEEQNS